jgi:GTP-binding protein
LCRRALCWYTPKDFFPQRTIASMATPRALRNIAIIAHVDHGKTTLVDKLLVQAGTFAAHQHVAERMLDSNDLERERGITIFAKNCAIEYHGTHINIVDTPGHADFGGEVERVLSMVDGVLLLVDAVEGPMPQTRFVTRKALAQGLLPIIVVNKVDRPGARPEWVVNQTFELFDKLGATEDQLDFPVIYASALLGYASSHPGPPGTDMRPLFEAIVARGPAPKGDPEAPLQLQISALDFSSYVGRLGIGRVRRGRIVPGQEVIVLQGAAEGTRGKIGQLLGFAGLERVPIAAAEAGDIVLVTGIDDLHIGTTLAAIDAPEALPMIAVDEPTLSMQFQVNTSPLAGRDGKYVTSRNLRERQEPFEQLTVDVDDGHQGAVMEALGTRRGELLDMASDSRGHTRLDYRIPARGLIGFQGEFMNLTRGTGLFSHVFDGYAPVKGDIPERRNGVLISAEDGDAVAYALWKLQERGRMFVSPGERVYEGMVIGVHSRDNDLVVNPIKTKQLTNIRAAGKDEAILLTPPIALTLEYAVEFIAEDELVEITPRSIRIRKRHLVAHERKKASREAA